ncbi:MAG: xanthine dehydrogenase family protein molybdopterin-binding subunit [Anaerolineae bacterium]|nr:xanthine dehydrogenase family protein molybdopterin-binding subunit [Anaerolineae bacterium]
MPTIKKTKVEFEGRIEEREAIVEPQHVQTWDQGARLAVVGQPAPRVDGIARVTGQAVYTHDVQLPGMLTGKFLRSPHPHARIVHIDSRKAEALPGVWLVWHCEQPPPVTDLEGRELFARELAYPGAEVAFVVAQDERIVEDAFKLIEVEYEALPFVHDLASATAEGAPPAFLDAKSNVINPDGQIYQRGDIEAGQQDADVMVDLVFTTPTAAHCCLETHGSVVQWEGEQVTVWHSTQSIFGTRSSLAQALDIPQDRVRAICNYVGGAFGSKWGAEQFTLLAALAARQTRRPVKAVLDRQEEHLVAGYRPNSKQHIRIGARNDGTLCFIDHESWVVTGAYGGGGSIIGGPTKDLYVCPNVRTTVWAVRANTDSGRAFRAPGYVEGTVALEGAMDELANRLGLDPLALRLKNYAEISPARDIPYTVKGLREAYETGAEQFGWTGRQARKTVDGPWHKGFGLASQIWGGGGGPPANATVQMLPDGTVEIAAGVQDLGTGTKTVIAQVAAEMLGLPLASVQVIIGDTQSTPFGPGSGGSVTLASITPAVREAVYDALRQFLDLAAYLLDLAGTRVEDFDLADGEIIYRPHPDQRITFREVAAKMGNYMIVGHGARGPNPDDKALNTFGAQFADVDVNVETGEVRVNQIVAVHQIGRVVNPLTAASQVYGGVMMGIGLGLSEERIIDSRTGLQLTADLEEYKPPTMLDTPVIQAFFVDQVDGEANTVGAKGLGEPPIIPPAAAIANAVTDAIAGVGGVRVTDLPLTPDRVLAALKGAAQ